MSLQKADQAVRGYLGALAKEGDAKQQRLQKLGHNVERTRRLDFRILVWTLADDVLQNKQVKIEARVRVGIRALNAVAIWALKAMDDPGARMVLSHYRMLLAEWKDKEDELARTEDEYAIVKNPKTVRKRVTRWAERNLIPYMEKIADASWGKDNVEPELPLVVENNAQQQSPFSIGNVVDPELLEKLAQLP